MNQFDPAQHIENRNKITDAFGYWPSFHDAEIKELRLTVADGEPWVPGSVSPVLDMVVCVFEMTKDLTPEGYFILTKHTLARLRFRNVDSLQMAGFSHQNCIFDLEFVLEPASPPQIGNLLLVRIDSSVGLAGEFKCQSAEVVSAEPCDEGGKPIPVIR